MVETVASLSPFEQARQFAALSGPFEPAAALPDALTVAPAQAVEVASQLARLCDTRPYGAPGKWLLRTPERRDVLRSLAEAETLHQHVAERRALEPDPDTRDLLDALLGNGDFSNAAVRLEVDAPHSIPHLERLILAIDRAGEVAPAYPLLDPLRSAFSLLQRDERWKEVEKQGVFGRDVERKAIEAWLDRPIERPPVRALYVQGPPGIGKSVLLDASVRAAYATLSPILLRLDFDRAGLDVQDIVGLTMEVARQVAQQIGLKGPRLLRERLEAASVEASPRTPTASRSQMPQPLANEIGRAVLDCGRPVLVLLDTLEVLRYRGETHPDTLFRWLDGLVSAGLRPMRVLAAGRGDALEGLPNRIGEPIALDGLHDPAASAMLDKLAVPAREQEEIKALAGGNPLLLRLAAEIVRRGGGKMLAGRSRKQLAASFLYRFLVSRIDDPLLRKIVDPGLVARRISAELIRDVLAPALELGRISDQTSERLWEDLAAQTWLVEPDPAAPGFLRHRSGMRALLLPLIYSGKPARSARIDAAAIGWFARRPEPWCRVEAGYHQLQLMRRRRSPPPLIDREIAAQIDGEMLAELAPVAQDLVHAVRGERSTQYRGESFSGPTGDDPGLVRELLGIIDRQDWIEGEHIIRDIVNTAGIGAQSPAADAIRAVWWRSGRWSRARRLLLDRDRFVVGDHDLRDFPPALALARLEMRAEFDPPAVLRWFDEDDRNRSYASEMAGDSPGIGNWGALGFLLEANGGAMFRSASRRFDENDPVSIATLAWSEDRELPVPSSLSEAAERLQARGAGPPSVTARDPRHYARLLAVLSPYAVPAINLAVSLGREWIGAAAKAGDHRLTEAGALLPWEAAPTYASGREDPISSVTRLGLFAEWAQAMAFLRRDPDLRLIGRSAEAWRRTMAGQWRYGRAPRRWRTPQPLDASLGLRLENLVASRDPRHAAMVELGLWSAHPEASGETVWARLKPRLDGVEKGLPPDRLKALGLCARRLLGRRVPSAFVPAVAVLTLWRDG